MTHSHEKRLRARPDAPVSRRELLAGSALLIPAWLLARPARAQAEWPTRPVRFVVPFPPGGSSDSLGRIIADGLRDTLPATVIVENRPGGTTQVGTEIVSRAEPDGYTWLQGSATAFSVLPHLRPVPYDAEHGFEFAGGIADYVPIVVVRKELGITTMAELIRAAKQQPGRLSFGSAGLASVGHISGEMLKRAAGIDLLHVPFKGSGDLIPGLISGQVDLIIDGVGLGIVKTGRGIPLAAFSARRHPELPEVPSLSEAGVALRLPEGGWGVMAPRGTPAAIVGRMSEALQKVVESPAAVEAMLRVGIVARWTPPQAYAKGLEDARAYYAELLTAIGLEEKGRK